METCCKKITDKHIPGIVESWKCGKPATVQISGGWFCNKHGNGIKAVQENKKKYEKQRIR